LPSAIYCPHGTPVDVCPDPVCQHAASLFARGAPRVDSRYVDTHQEPDLREPEELEHELALPDWLDELRYEPERRTVTMRAKSIVRFADTARVATFDYELELEHVDAFIDALTKLRDRARQEKPVIDVPSSESSARSRRPSS
jgi:hypothetical protein